MTPKILCFTPAYGSRSFISETVPAMRAAAGLWFDWHLYLGRPSPELRAAGEALLADSQRGGIQRLTIWPENRGQHHAFADALAIARAEGYEWLLRLDDDVKPKTARFLRKMIQQVETLRDLAKDTEHRFVFGPRVAGLKHPIAATGSIRLGQPFDAEVVPLLGGVCRLHPVAALEGFEPDIYRPVGRGDPETIAAFMQGALVRFPGIRVMHNTRDLEALDSPEDAYLRKMGKYWAFLGRDAASALEG